MDKQPSGGVMKTDSTEDRRQIVDVLLSSLVDDLVRLVRIPSVSGDGADPVPLFAAHDAIVDLLHGVGVVDIEELVIEGKVAPVVVARIAAPAGAPTVLL